MKPMASAALVKGAREALGGRGGVGSPRQSGGSGNDAVHRFPDQPGWRRSRGRRPGGRVCCNQVELSPGLQSDVPPRAPAVARLSFPETSDVEGLKSLAGCV